jgi:hypothetical protein
MPGTELVTVIELHTRDDVITFGEALSLQEQEYVVAAINRFLEASGQPVDIENDLVMLDTDRGQWGRRMNDDMQMDSLDHMGRPD